MSEFKDKNNQKKYSLDGTTENHPQKPFNAKEKDITNILPEMYLEIFHSLPTPAVISKFSNGQIVDVNNTWLQDFDYSREDVLGMTTTEIQFFAEPGQRDRIIQDLGNEGHIFSSEFNFRHKSGAIIPYLSSFVKIELGAEVLPSHNRSKYYYSERII